MTVKWIMHKSHFSLCVSWNVMNVISLQISILFESTLTNILFMWHKFGKDGNIKSSKIKSGAQSN